MYLPVIEFHYATIFSDTTAASRAYDN